MGALKEDTMKYLLTIYGQEAAMANVPADQMKAMMDTWYKYTEEIGKATNLLGGEALQPTATAKTLRQASGDTITADGPFAETKEQLGGFYLIDVADEKTAMEWAAKMPNLPFGGSVEVRPIQQY